MVEKEMVQVFVFAFVVSLQWFAQFYMASSKLG